jgi:ribonuclease P protein component
MKTESIKTNRDFRVVYKYGKSRVDKYLVVYLLKKKNKENRLGITVSKKVGNSVIRNRVRRLIKESFLKLEDKIQQGYDIVVVARVVSNQATYQKIDRSINKLLNDLMKE